MVHDMIKSVVVVVVVVVDLMVLQLVVLRTVDLPSFLPISASSPEARANFPLSPNFPLDENFLHINL